jgi:uncharacterized integral membrane protein (TIGR00698 family)
VRRQTHHRPAAPGFRYEWSLRRVDVPGIALTIGIALFAAVMCRGQSEDAVISPVLVAIITGAVLANTGLRTRFGGREARETGREDRFEPGLKYVGTWVLRALVILMGMRVSTGDLPVGSAFLIAGVLTVTVTGSFFVAHVMGALLDVPRTLTDLIAGGTMICGASAVNAIAPGVGARREEQAIAITSLFLFSVVALLTFPGAAKLMALGNGRAGLWAGLAVNDFSSAIAAGHAIGSPAEVTAAMSKSARVLLLGPAAIAFRILRGSRGRNDNGRPATAVPLFPGYLLGFVALAFLRYAGDELWGSGTRGWALTVAVDEKLGDLMVVMVAGAIGLQLDLKRFLRVGLRAVAVSAAAWAWTAGTSAVLIYANAHGAKRAAIGIGVGALSLASLAYAVIGRRSNAPLRDDGEPDLAPTAKTARARLDPFRVALVAVVVITIGARAYTSYSRWSRERRANSGPRIREPLSARAAALRRTRYDARCPPGMTFIDGGQFLMGSDDHFSPNELPIHAVNVRGFCYDVTEVTVHEYLACVDAGACTPVNNTARWPDLSESNAWAWDQFCNANHHGRADHPINCVTWDQSDRYCRAHGFRLPTEDEWEYVARGGAEQRRFTWGSERPRGDLANMCDEGCAATVMRYVREWGPLFPGMRDPYPATAPIGSFPNGVGRWGILDQTGNVTEWTASFFCPYPDTSCLGGDRVARGNGYLANLLMKIRAARRNHDVPWHRSPDAGFRCARSIP